MRVRSPETATLLFLLARGEVVQAYYSDIYYDTVKYTDHRIY